MKFASPEHLRWKTGAYLDAVNRSRQLVGGYEVLSFREIAKAMNKEGAEGLIDLRGLNLAPSITSQTRVKPDDNRLLDLSKSVGQDFVIQESNFEECNFSQSRWSNGNIRNCSFTKCLFQNSVWNATPLGIRSTFLECDFTGMSGRGDFFSFGRECRFEKCTFNGIEIKNFDDHSVVFVCCRFSGLVRNGKFRGSSYILRKRLHSVRNLFDRSLASAKFINCDFSGLTVAPDVFEPGTIERR